MVRQVSSLPSDAICCTWYVKHILPDFQFRPKSVSLAHKNQSERRPASNNNQKTNPYFFKIAAITISLFASKDGEVYSHRTY